MHLPSVSFSGFPRVLKPLIHKLNRAFLHVKLEMKTVHYDLEQFFDYQLASLSVVYSV